MSSQPQKLTPEQLLAQAEHEERKRRRGRLKVFLGYSSGVGKSFQMFDEGRRRSERGEDVVVCAVQHEYPPEVQSILRKMEIIPMLRPAPGCEGAESIDVEAVLRRHPQVALIDGLAYDNPPGSRHAYRWQDVEELLDSGVCVVATVNLQYLEKLRDPVERITGKRTSCTIPSGFLDQTADEVVVVDAPAIESLKHGAASSDDAARLAEVHRLSQLREMALLVAAGVVDNELENYLRTNRMEHIWRVHERILVCVTPRSNASAMIESGRRNADRFHGELYVAYVHQPAVSHGDQTVLQRNLEYARQLGATVVTLNGLDPVEAILRFAQEKCITQIYVGHSTREGAWRRLWRSSIDRLIRSAEGMDVVVYPH